MLIFNEVMKIKFQLPSLHGIKCITLIHHCLHSTNHSLILIWIWAQAQDTWYYYIKQNWGYITFHIEHLKVNRFGMALGNRLRKYDWWFDEK